MSLYRGGTMATNPRKVKVKPIVLNSFRTLTIVRKKRTRIVDFSNPQFMPFKHNLQLFGWVFRQLQSATTVQMKILTEPEVGNIQAILFLDGINITEQLDIKLLQIKEALHGELN